MVDFDDLDLINKVFNSVLIIEGLVMILLNTLLAYILIKKFANVHRTLELKLMIILGIVEIYFGFVTLIFSILKLSYGYHILDQGTYTCFASGILMQINPRIEVCLATILAMLRYTIVCHQKEKTMWFWLIILFLMSLPCIVIYMIGAIRMDSLPSNSYIMCMPFLKPDEESSVVNVIISLCFLIPCWITTYCYFAIGWSANKKLNSMRVEAHNTNDEILVQVIKKEKRKLIIQIIFVFCLYNLTFMTSYITFILKFAIGYKRSPAIDAFSFTITHLAFAINSLVTISFQPQVSSEFQVMLVKYQAKFKSIFKRIFRQN
jgi:hypothetical protein